MINNNNQISGNRIAVLDKLRGFTLLGIFLMNIPSLAGVSPEDTPLLRSVLDILIRDSARPLFALMFGISICLIYDRALEKKTNPYPLLVRRLLLLAAAGGLHAYAVWAGDILMMFAMGGFVLLLCMRLAAKWLLLLGLSFWLLYVVGLDFFNSYTGYSFSIVSAWGSEENSPLWDYFLTEFSSMANHLGFLLLGMYLHRVQALSYISKHREKAGIFAFILFFIGALGKSAAAEMPESLLLSSLQDFFPFVLTVGVMLGVVLMGTVSKSSASLLSPFTAIGRTTFTNYLMQSLVFVTIFTSGRTIFDGIGLWSEPSYYFALSAGIILFIIQAVLSHVWMKKFYYGPFEWIWRIGTYGKLVPFKK